MIERATYLEKLISKQWNGRIKIITGIGRSGKSTILFEIYREYLLKGCVFFVIKVTLSRLYPLAIELITNVSYMADLFVTHI